MNDFTLKAAFEWIAALLVSIGGSSVIIFALAKWFGGVLAQKVLEKDKNRYQQELEKLKTEYQLDIETLKDKLEKARSKFARYSEHQFSLYNELWRDLVLLKDLGHQLWERAEISTLKKFNTQRKKARLSTEQSVLLIEQQHYLALVDILEAFEDFEKGKLIVASRRAVHDVPDEVLRDELRYTIERNGQLKDQFDALLTRLSLEFRQQIKGE